MGLEPPLRTIIIQFLERLLQNEQQQKMKIKKAIKNNKKQLSNTNAYCYENKLFLSKEKEIF